MDFPGRPQLPEVTVEWDKNERQRARNRVNQRNYRRRKSEQQQKDKDKGKGKGKDRATSSSQSPGKISRDTPDILSHEEIEKSLKLENTASASELGIQVLPETASSPDQQLYRQRYLSLDGTNASSDFGEVEGSPLHKWMTSTFDSGGSPPEISDSTQVLPSESWQLASGFDPRLDLAGLSTQVQDMTWYPLPLSESQVLPHPGSMTTTGTAAVYSLPHSHVPVPGRGRTTLHLAAEKGHVDCVRILLLNGADPNARDIDGFSALHIAAQHGYGDVVATLIERGCDIDATTRDGCTAIHLAARGNRFDVVRQLLHAGSGTNVEMLR